MKSYGRIVKAIEEHPWAILPSALEAMLEAVELRLDGGRFSAEELAERLGAAQAPPVRRAVEGTEGGAIAVVPIHGLLAHRMNLFTALSGGMSTQQLSGAIRGALADPSVSALVLDVDSPGGSVFGIEELADEIFRARGPKPIVAVANATAASAAYWLASQADEVIVTPSGEVGSIGVVAVHRDVSEAAAKAGVKFSVVSAGKHKADGQETAPLTDSHRAYLQQRVDGYYTTFVRHVARGRGATAADVREGYGEGRVLAARDAVKAGLADGIGTLDGVIGRLASGARRVIGPSPAALAEVADFRARLVALGAAPAEPQAPQVPPDEDGRCPEGYEKDDDGMCHPVGAKETPA